MSEPMISDPWVERLKDPVRQEEALTELRVRLVRGLKKAFSSTGESFAEDIAQDALIRILEKIDQFEGRSQFSTWAMSIAVRLATSQTRRKHFKDVSLEQFTNGEGLKLDLAVDTVPSASEQLEQDTIYQKLSELIDGLSDRQQRYWVGCLSKKLPTRQPVTATLFTSSSTMHGRNSRVDLKRLDILPTT